VHGDPLPLGPLPYSLSHTHTTYVIFRFSGIFCYFFFDCVANLNLLCVVALALLLLFLLLLLLLLVVVLLLLLFSLLFLLLSLYPQRAVTILAIQWKVFAITLNITHTICTILFILVINCLLNNYVARRHLWQKKIYAYRYIDRHARLSTSTTGQFS